MAYAAKVPRTRNEKRRPETIDPTRNGMLLKGGFQKLWCANDLRASIDSKSSQERGYKEALKWHMLPKCCARSMKSSDLKPKTPLEVEWC